MLGFLKNKWVNLIIEIVCGIGLFFLIPYISDLVYKPFAEWDIPHWLILVTLVIVAFILVFVYIKSFIIGIVQSFVPPKWYLMLFQIIIVLYTCFMAWWFVVKA